MRLSLVLISIFTLGACQDVDNNKDTVDSGGTVQDMDVDGDGYLQSEDCDDNDASVNPGSTEVCDGIDNDCDGEIDEDVTTTYYADQDGDGFGNSADTLEACEKPSGYVPNGNDCDDTTAEAYPGGTEVCDGIDNDCDGDIDEDLVSTWYADSDEDGFGDPESAVDACDQPSGYVDNSDDCDDTTAQAYPYNDEICDEIDNDCDGMVDEDVTNTYYADMDSDGYGDASITTDACSLPTGYSSNPEDCDDGNDAVNPGAAEICDGLDNDCDGVTDEEDALDASTWYADSDTDGYGDAANSLVSCDQPTGYVADDTDCDDGNQLANPGMNEFCNGYDDDCDGTIDEDDAVDVETWYLDRDTDGYGDPTASQDACSQPSMYVADNTDCDDLDAAVNPGATEICNGTDDDCDGTIDEDDAADATTWYADRDGDGYGDISNPDVACNQPTGYVADDTDCDDLEPSTNPGADEYCNGVDDDCDGTVDEDDALDVDTWYQDLDNDGYGNAAVSEIDCNQPTGYVSDDTDCNDSSAAANPGELESCDGIDNDCDGTVDEDDSIDAQTWYADNDTDGYGDASASSQGCEQPSGYVSDATDCDDSDATSFPGGTEVCDGADNDCNGTVDDNPTDGDTWYADADADGTGDAGSTTVACSTPSGYVDNTWDCDDTDGSEPIVVDIATGSSAGSGTISSPLDAIQSGIDAASACVIVFGGTYDEQIDLNGKSIDLWGVEGTDVTIIDPNLVTCDESNPSECGSTVTIASNAGAIPTIHGFSIRGGTGTVASSSSSQTCADSSSSHAGNDTCTITVYEYCGGGVYVEGDDPYLYDVIIEDNILPEFTQVAVGDFQQYWLYSYGGGLCVVNGLVTLEGVGIHDNFADQGGGIYGTDVASITMTESSMMDNEATDGAGANLDSASISLANSVIGCNIAATDGGGLFLQGSGTLGSAINVVFYKDESAAGSSHGSAGYGESSTTLEVMNTAVFTDLAAYSFYGAGTGTFSYNDIYNSSGSSYRYGGTYNAGTGDLSGDPLFVSANCDGNPNNDDFSLSSSSPAINTGNPSSAYDDVDGSPNDIGAYGGPGGDW